MRYFRYLFYSILFILTSCNFKPREMVQITDKCFVVSDYNKPLCLNESFNSPHPTIFVDKNKIEAYSGKFANLELHKMMVVDIKGNNIILSNVNFSIKVRFDGKRLNNIKIQDIYYVIVKKIYLSESRIIISADDANNEDIIVTDPENYEGTENP